MKILYLDCGMGAAGDMLTAALCELLPEPEAFLEELNALGLPGVVFQKETLVRCGITGTHIRVHIQGEEETEQLHSQKQPHRHQHRSLRDIEEMVSRQLSLPQKVQKEIMAVYTRIAEAESRVHGVPVSEIHFHEVGAMDAIADITAVCMLMERLAPDVVVASAVHVGSGQVQCAHGLLPVPAPATALLLQDVPCYGGNIRGELCTPTGAALLKHFVTRFGAMPQLRPQAIGYGMGQKDFEAANCIRAILGEGEDAGAEIYELSCNVDDMTGEAVGFAVERLLAEGALDVYTIPVGMKKSRPGLLLRVMCREEDKERLLRVVFLHTTTLGIRVGRLCRYVLDRRIETVDTAYGPVRCKVSSGYGVERRKYEYEDLSRIAREQGLSLESVRLELEEEKKGKRKPCI